MKSLLNILKIVLLSSFSTAFAQQWGKVNTTALSHHPTSFSVDIKGIVYVGFEDGSLRSYGNDGEILEVFSTENQVPISLIEASNSLKIFIFRKNNQQITTLDRFSAQPRLYELENPNLRFTDIACPSLDQMVWLIESNPQRLKKINVLFDEVVFDTNIDVGDSIHFMKSYQNLLFLSDENGLHIIDQYGGEFHNFEQKGITYFQIIDEQVFFLQDSYFVQYNWMKDKIVNKIPTPQKNAITILKAKDIYITVTRDSLSWYRYLE